MQIDENKFKRSIRVSAGLFLITVANTTILIRNSEIRTVEFLSIFACGMAAGALLTNVILYNRMKENR